METYVIINLTIECSHNCLFALLLRAPTGAVHSYFDRPVVPWVSCRYLGVTIWIFVCQYVFLFCTIFGIIHYYEQILNFLPKKGTAGIICSFGSWVLERLHLFTRFCIKFAANRLYTAKKHGLIKIFLPTPPPASPPPLCLVGRGST